MFFVTDKSKPEVEQSVDKYGDSFTRDVSIDELRKVRIQKYPSQDLNFLNQSPKIFESMPTKLEPGSTTIDFKTELREHDHDLGQLPGWMFEGLLLLVIDSDHPGLKHNSSPNSQIIPKILVTNSKMKRACNIAQFAGADITADLADEQVTHIVVAEEDVNTRVLRERISRYFFLPASKQTVRSLPLFCHAYDKNSRKRLPRIVTIDWIEQSWAEQTLLDEESK